MKPLVSGSILGAIAAAAMLVAARRRASRRANAGRFVSAVMSRCSGPRRPADCDLPDAGRRWNQTSLDNIGRCAGGIANSDGRLVCGRRGGGLNAGNERGRDHGRESGWSGERERGWRGERDGYGDSVLVAGRRPRREGAMVWWPRVRLGSRLLRALTPSSDAQGAPARRRGFFCPPTPDGAVAGVA